jgi:phage gp36-like protein
MSYVVYADVDNEITSLGGLVPDGKVALTWVNAKIAIAEMEINARLSSKYITPITPASDIVKSISLNLTCYYLLRQNYTQEDGNSSDWVEQYRKTANDMLKNIEDGTITLDAPVAQIANAVDAVQSSTNDIARVFTTGQYNTDGTQLNTGTLDNL